MAYKRLDFFPRQLPAQHDGVPMFLAEMVAGHNGFVLVAEHLCELRVALEAEVNRRLAFGDEREDFSLRRFGRITNLVDGHTFAKRIIQKCIRKTEYVCLDLFVIHTAILTN